MKSFLVALITILIILGVGNPCLSKNSAERNTTEENSLINFDNEAPPPVEDLNAQSALGGTVKLFWNYPQINTIQDFEGFYIYREKHLEEIKLVDSLFVNKDTTSFSYLDAPLKCLEEGRFYSYKVLAFDTAKNISDGVLTPPVISDSTSPPDPVFVWDTDSYDFSDTLDMDTQIDSVFFYKSGICNTIKVKNPNHDRMDKINEVHYIRFQWVRNYSSLFEKPYEGDCSQNRCISDWMPIDLKGKLVIDSLCFDLDGHVLKDVINGSLYLYAAQFKDKAGNTSIWGRMDADSNYVEAIQDVFPPEPVTIVKKSVKTYDNNFKGLVNLQWQAKQNSVSGIARFIVRRELCGKATLDTLPPDSLRYPDPILNDINHLGKACIAKYCIVAQDNAGNTSDPSCVFARHKVGPKISYINENPYFNDSLVFQIEYDSEIPVRDFLIYENDNFIGSCELETIIDNCGNVLPENTCTIPFNQGENGDDFYIYTSARYEDGDESLNSNKKWFRRDTEVPAVNDLKVTNNKPDWAYEQYYPWDGNLYLEWSRPEDDTTKDIICYDIFRNNGNDEQKIGAISTNEDVIHFVDLANDSLDTLLTYKFYTYYVKARDKAGNYSAASNKDSSYCNRAPIIQKAKHGSKSIEICWTRPTPRLPRPHYKTSVRIIFDGNTIVVPADTNKTCFVFHNPLSEVIYYFQVQEITNSDTTEWSKPFKQKFQSHPTDLIVTNEKPDWADSSLNAWDGNIYLEWTRPGDAVEYEIYRDSVLVKTIKTTEDTIRCIDLANPTTSPPSFDHIFINEDSLLTYRFYSYAVIAFDNVDTSSVSDSKYDYCNRAPTIYHSKLGSTQIDICWRRPHPLRDYADNFDTRIQVYENETLVKDTTVLDILNFTFDIPEPKSEQTYTFRVQEKQLGINADSLETAWSKPFLQKFQAPPNDLIVTNQQPPWADSLFNAWDGNLYLQWTQPGDAKGYEIYRDSVLVKTIETTEDTIRYVDLANPTNPPGFDHIIINEDSLVTYEPYSYYIKAFDREDTSGVSDTKSDYCNRAPIIYNAEVENEEISIFRRRPSPSVRKKSDFNVFLKVYKDSIKAERLVESISFYNQLQCNFQNSESGHTYLFTVKEEPINALNKITLQTAWSEPFEVPYMIGPPKIEIHLQPQPILVSSEDRNTTKKGCIFVSWKLDKSKVSTEVESFIINRLRLNPPDFETFKLDGTKRDTLDCGLDPFVEYVYIIRATDRFTDLFDQKSDNKAIASIDPLWIYTPKVKPFSNLANPNVCDIETPPSKFFNSDTFCIKWGWINQDFLFLKNTTFGADSCKLQLSLDPNFVNHVDSTDWVNSNLRCLLLKRPSFVNRKNNIIYVRIKAKDHYGFESPWSTEYRDLGFEKIIFDPLPPPQVFDLHINGITAADTRLPDLVDVRLSWGDVKDNQSGTYKYEIWRNNGISSAIDTVIESAYFDRLLADSSLFDFSWYVLGIDSVGNKQTQYKPIFLTEGLTKSPEIINDSIKIIQPNVSFYWIYGEVFLNSPTIQYFAEYSSSLKSFDGHGDKQIRKSDWNNNVYFVDSPPDSFFQADTLYFRVKARYHKNGIYFESGWSKILKQNIDKDNESGRDQPILTGVNDPYSKPRRFNLQQNFPNPFNEETSIAYQLPSQGFVTIETYDLMGKKIKTLQLGEKPAGFFVVNWAGRNDEGQSLSTGAYFYRITVISENRIMYVQTRKLLLIK